GSIAALIVSAPNGLPRSVRSNAPLPTSTTFEPTWARTATNFACALDATSAPIVRRAITVRLVARLVIAPPCFVRLQTLQPARSPQLDCAVGYAEAARCPLGRRAAQPRPAKPTSIIAQVEDSGTELATMSTVRVSA